MAASFALITFNQEAFVAEAVRGALAQTIPLEILISDDCSTDRTFDVIREETKGYEGPHKVVVRRNDRNLGLIDHVNLMFELASEEIVILAAGDDVSLPERSAEICRKFASDPEIMAVHSPVTKISPNGKPWGTWEPPIWTRDYRLERNLLSMALQIGASAGYRKSLFDQFGPITEREAFEDLVLGFRAMLAGRISSIDKSLVLYRTEGGLSTAGNSHRRNIAILRQRLADMARSDRPFPWSYRMKIRREIALLTCRRLFGLARRFRPAS